MPYCYYDVDSTYDYLTHVQIHNHAWDLYNGTTVLGTLTYEDGTTTYEKYDGKIKEVGISRTVGTVTSGETKTFYFYLFKEY